jgi:hypothetical protein
MTMIITKWKVDTRKGSAQLPLARLDSLSNGTTFCFPGSSEIMIKITPVVNGTVWFLGPSEQGCDARRERGNAMVAPINTTIEIREG